MGKVAMTTHELARLLLEYPDLPGHAVSIAATANDHPFWIEKATLVPGVHQPGKAETLILVCGRAETRDDFLPPTTLP